MASSLIRLIGVPLDLGAGRRGVDMGPSALRIAGARKTLERLGYEVIDDGDIVVVCPEVQEVRDPKLRYLPEIVRTVDNLSGKVERTMGRGEFPVVLGGDHSMAIGTISGAAAHHRGEDQKMGLLWFDAHGDANTPDTSPSGNIHGMPLAVVLGRGAKELVEVGGFGRDEARLDPAHVALIGVRSVDECERGVLKELGITVFTMENIDRRGIHAVTKDAIAIASAGTEAFRELRRRFDGSSRGRGSRDSGERRADLSRSAHRDGACGRKRKALLVRIGGSQSSSRHPELDS